MYRPLGVQRLIYRTRIASYVKAGLIDYAVKVFEEMTLSECRVFGIDYNRFIGVLIRHSRLDLAHHYYSKMAPLGFSLSSFTYSRFISGLCQTKEFMFIEKLLNDMDRLHYKGIRPDNKACGALAVGLCDGGQVDLAYELIIGVISGGLSEVSTLVYNALISGFCRAGGIDKALAIVSFMSRTGCKPDLVTYNVLLNYCCNEFMFEEAVKLLKKMECRMGVLPDRIFYTTIIDHHCKSGKVEMAHDIFRDMVEKGITPDVVSFNALINGFCKSSRVSEVMHLYEEMLQRGSFPDEVTYKLIIGALVRENKLSDACRVWDQMMEKGLTLDRGVSEMLINAIQS
ncbi:hypothetical protein OIU84_021724 [Salix udensis]|uniref:Pentatricopeptide repeat-containing protein n=1 Tax=Salix udensis TaxID=889485 RepID=A0AAD6PHD8_9ROSI|nr:hypothetical protein OIU84_021724 [Salix udensis]